MCLEPTVRAVQLLALQAKKEPGTFAIQAGSAAAPFAAYQAGKKEPPPPYHWQGSVRATKGSREATSGGTIRCRYGPARRATSGHDAA